MKVDERSLRPENEYTLIGTKRPEQPADPSFCTEVELVLKDATGLLEGAHVVSLINRDGQAAAAHIPGSPATITSVKGIEHGTAPVTVEARGSGFADRMTAVWKDAAGNETMIDADGVVKKSDSELAVTVIPGETAGAGRLTLVTAEGLRSSRPVTIS